MEYLLWIRDGSRSAGVIYGYEMHVCISEEFKWIQKENESLELNRSHT